MDSVLPRFYQVNIYLMTFVGLWPYGVTTFRKVVRVSTSTLLISAFCQQFLSLFTTKFNLNMVVKNLAPMSFTAIFALKHFSFCINHEGVRALLDEMQSDWDLMKTEDERRILEGHASLGRRRTIEFVLITIPSALSSCMFPFLPDFLDVVAPLNQSRPRVLLTTAEYFVVNQEDHFYLAMIHIDLVVVLGCISLVATETYMVIIMQHISALLHITGCRLTNAFADCTRRVRSARQPPASVDSIMETVVLHRRSLQFGKSFFDTFAISYAFLVTLGVLASTVTLYRISLVDLTLEMLNEIIMCFSFLVIIFGSMFFINMTAYMAIEQSYELFRTTYNTDWYHAPKEWQRMLLFIMLKCKERPTFDIFGIYKPSAEAFTEIVKLSVSYFMVIRSVQSV